MVECELDSHKILKVSWRSFNRYMVECECIFPAADRVQHGAVLIDTWWNVNQQRHMLVTLIQLVLIDTWWNVNCCSQYQGYSLQAF